MAEEEITVDIRDHELSWLFTDSVGLFQLGRKPTALLVALCGVDALAHLADPKNDKVRERVEKFLKDRMPPFTGVQNFNIRVPKKQGLMRLESILYKYVRNPIVHEGAQLDVDEPYHFAVVFDWKLRAPSVRVDDAANVLVLGGDYIANALFEVIKGYLGEELLARARAKVKQSPTAPASTAPASTAPASTAPSISSTN